MYLKDIWPSTEEIKAVMAEALTPEMFRQPLQQRLLPAPLTGRRSIPVDSKTYAWKSDSTYVQNPPFFEAMAAEVNGGGMGDIYGGPAPGPAGATALPPTTFLPRWGN